MGKNGHWEGIRYFTNLFRMKAPSFFIVSETEKGMVLEYRLQIVSLIKILLYCKFSLNIRKLATETLFGSGSLPGKMLLVMIVESNKIDAYFRAG